MSVRLKSDNSPINLRKSDDVDRPVASDWVTGILMETSDFLLEYSWKPVIFYWNTHGKPVIFYWNTHGKPVNILLEISLHVEIINIVHVYSEGFSTAQCCIQDMHPHARFWLDFLRLVMEYSNVGKG